MGRMKVDFFRIEMPSAARRFEDLLAEVAGMPDDKTRAVEIAGQQYRLQRLEVDGRRYEGEMVRIRMDEPPLLAKLDGAVKPIPLDTDEGIGSETAFLYDRNARALLIQVNRNGVNAGRLVKYFELKGYVGAPISAAHIPRGDIAATMSRLKKVSRFRIRLAGGFDPRLVLGHGPETDRGIELLGDSYAPHIDVSISVGRGSRATLAIDQIAEKARRFVGQGPEGDGNEDLDMEAVEIYGQYDDDTPAELKLLRFTMFDYVDIPTSSSKRAPYAERRDAIRTVWERHRDELTAIFGPG